MENQEKIQVSEGWEPSKYDSEERKKKVKERINQALQEMEDDELIRCSVDAGNLIYVIYVKKTYKVCSFLVGKTGKHWLDSRREKNPERVTIKVDLWEDLNSIKHKILKAIEAKERGWLLRKF